MVRVLGHLSGIKKLTIDYDRAKILVTGAPYNYLEDLKLGFDFTDRSEMSVALCLIGSSPNLWRLEIKAYTRASPVEPVLEFLKDQGHLNFSFNKLEFVKMVCRGAVRSEVEFIKFVLANSPALKEMTILLNNSDEAQVALQKELLQFQGASAQAKIIFLKPYLVW
ncbi:uncharacterized protein LOC122665151 [Telopea speciosissima]|uniref:uncharacterized protein LOC122665151 n=1 Tax=Telopea speciosissima TaxID=54955 RepID=UPI001CC7312C|nr:uncharacterized protein LOC122665151 [Telopea speciosissima]